MIDIPQYFELIEELKSGKKINITIPVDTLFFWIEIFQNAATEECVDEGQSQIYQQIRDCIKSIQPQLPEKINDQINEMWTLIDTLEKDRQTGGKYYDF